jgi:hypothetical protein
MSKQKRSTKDDNMTHFFKKVTKIAAVCVVALTLSACSDASGAHRVLVNAGYHDIQITGFKFIGCGKDDNFTTGFSAVHPNNPNVRIEGVVCSGILKGAVIRVF